MEHITSDYLLGKKVKLFQSQNAYRTSSDAVLLAAMVYRINEHAKILDVGSGLGGVSLCLAYRFCDAEITGFELQNELVTLANISAAENNFDNLKYYTHDIKSKTAPMPNGSFDVVVTNPPYTKNGSKSPNKSKAFAHNLENITLEEWIKFCLKMLKPYGFFYMIYPASSLDEIIRILAKRAGNIRIVPVYSKKGQKAERILLMAQKDSKSPLLILPPLVMHEGLGHTKEAEDILRGGMSYAQALNLS